MAFGVKHVASNQFLKAFPLNMELVGEANIIKPKQSRWG